MSKRPPLPVVALEACGRVLRRPECVLATLDGDVYVPEWPAAAGARAGVTVVRRDGSQQTWSASADFDLRPNGIALTPQGDFLIANLGDDGGIWRMAIDGTVTALLTEIDGVPLPPANFVTIDIVRASRRGGTTSPTGLWRCSTIAARALSRMACTTRTKCVRILRVDGCTSSKHSEGACGVSKPAPMPDCLRPKRW
jgi:hypothetical protein